jgi:hypothetical protein
MRYASSRREGFALAVALAAIVIIGGIIAGVFFASTQEYRIGRNSLLQTRALTSAEYGLNTVLTSQQWNSTWNTPAANGVLAVRDFQPSSGSTGTVRVTHLGNGQYWLVADGLAGSRIGAQGRRRIGVLVKIKTPKVNMLGALTTRGSVKVGGSSYISGNDTTYADWDCPPAGAPLAGIATNDAANVTTPGCNNLSCVTGNPPIKQDPQAAADSTYFKFGDVDWAQLVAMAQKTFPGSSTLTGMKASYSGSACNTGDAFNWGDPYHTLGALAYCETYFPIIYSPGDLKLTGGYGQGILLVEGDLSVSGGFEFYGPVIVKGSLKTTGTGGHFNGGVMAANVDLEQNTVLGDAVVHFSRCAINKALTAVGTPVLAKGRSWVELF